MHTQGCFALLFVFFVPLCLSGKKNLVFETPHKSIEDNLFITIAPMISIFSPPPESGLQLYFASQQS